MAGISGINDYSFLFSSGNTANNNLAGLTNSLFGASSNSMLGDYAMIKSGTYKKLLTAYYKKVQAADTDGADTSKTNRYDRFDKTQDQLKQENAAANQYLEVKDNADALRSAAYSLNSYTLYREKTAEDGTTSYDRDEIKKSVQNFVSTYNTLLSASSEVKSTGMLGQISGLMKLTSDNSKALEAIGITVGKDNRLSLDEKALDSADVDSIAAVFKGNSSYGNSVSLRATEIARQANSSAFNSFRGASSYSQGGSYSVLGSTSSMLDQLF